MTASTDSAAAPALSSPPQVSATLPPALVALEEKMGQLQVNSERYTETVTAVSAVSLAVAHGRSRARTKLSTSKLSGEVSLSPAQGEVVGSRGEPEQIAIGSTLYLHSPAIARRDGGRPWIRVEHGNADVLFPFHGGSSLLEEKGGGTGSYAELIDLIATAVGTVEEIGPATVGGQRTTEFSASIQPLALVKGVSRRQLSKLRAAIHIRMDVFITEAGLPVRVAESVSEGHGRDYIHSSSTIEITGTEVAVSVEPPPANETIGEAELEKLNATKRHTAESK